MPTKRYNFAAACSGYALIFAGGNNGRDRLTAVEVLDQDARQWSIASSLPHPYSSATLGIAGNRLYMLGGYDQQGETRSVLSCPVDKLLRSCRTTLAGKLRPSRLVQKPVWRSVADVPRKASTCSVICGRLVAVGGIDEAGKETAAISSFDEGADSWQSMANMPTARREPLVAICSGKVIVVGGVVGLGFYTRTELDTVEIGTVL